MLKTRHSSSLEYHSRSDEYYFEVFSFSYYITVYLKAFHCLIQIVSIKLRHFESLWLSSSFSSLQQSQAEMQRHTLRKMNPLPRLQKAHREEPVGKENHAWSIFLSCFKQSRFLSPPPLPLSFPARPCSSWQRRRVGSTWWRGWRDRRGRSQSRNSPPRNRSTGRMLLLLQLLTPEMGERRD